MSSVADTGSGMAVHLNYLEIEIIVECIKSLIERGVSQREICLPGKEVSAQESGFSLQKTRNALGIGIEIQTPL